MVRENCTILNKSFVCERVVGNEDSWAEACVNGDDGSILGIEFAEGLYRFKEGSVDPLEVAEYWDVYGSWRLLILIIRNFVEKEGFEEG